MLSRYPAKGYPDHATPMLNADTLDSGNRTKLDLRINLMGLHDQTSLPSQPRSLL